MAVQTTGSGAASGWRAGPQGNDLPSPIPFPAHINTFVLQTGLLSFPLHKEFINYPPGNWGWDEWEEVLSCKTEVAQICKNSLCPPSATIGLEYKGWCESCLTQLPLPELHLGVPLQSLLQWALPPTTRRDESGGGPCPCPCPWFKWQMFVHWI